MTITTANSSQLVAGDGSKTSFSFNFVGDSTSVISVYTVAANGAMTLLSPTTYSITLNAPVTNSIWGVGGTIIYPLVGSPIALGTYLFIQRVVPYQQNISILNQGNFYPQVIEQAIDLLAMQIQQLQSRTTQFRGIWLTSTAYFQGDIVQDGVNGNNSNNYYICQIANTSGVWATDLAAGDWAISALASVPTGTLTLTGDITGTGSSPIATTLANVNSNVGTFNFATITVNAKGLITAASGGSAGSGTVSSVTYTGDGVLQSSTPSSAVTTTGTVAATLIAQAKNTVLAGPTTGSNANPTFRALVSADVPSPTFTPNVTQVSALNPSAQGTSSVFKMLGLGQSGTTFTPATTGLVEVSITGNVLYIASSTNQIKMMFGTGSAPVNNAAVTGTLMGTNQSAATSSATALISPFSISATVSGLTLSTTYWFDLATASSSGSALTLTNLNVIISEIK